MNEMSYRALIKNKDKSIDFVIANGSKIIGRNYSASGVRKSDLNYIKKIFSELFYNNKCEYIDTVRKYQIYYDRKNNIKHFLKDGKENLELFIRYNGTDALCYLNKKSVAKIATVISILGLTITIGVNSVLKEFGNVSIDYDKYDYDIEQAVNNYFHINSENIEQHKPLDAESALKCIQDSSLDDKTKEILSNENLVEDMFAYYKGTLLEYSAKEKFDNISIVQYKTNTDDDYDIGGFYNVLYPNIIHINSKYLGISEYDSIVDHEYIHLFQAPNLLYKYFVEASAELGASEYYHRETKAYLTCISNLKLTMDIIGPEPVIKMLYSGDDDDFLHIIRSNLSIQDSSRLLFLLNVKSSDCEDENEKLHTEIRGLLCKLYKSLNGHDIQDDPDIMYDLIYENEKDNRNNIFYRHNDIYFNVREMPDVEEFNGIKVSTEVLKAKGIIKLQNFVLAKRQVDSFDDYEKLSSDNSVNFTPGWSKVIDGYIYGTLNRENNEFYLFDEPLGEGEYSMSEDGIMYDKTKVSGKNISILDAFRKGYITLIARKTFIENEVIDDNWNIISEYTEYISTNPNIKLSASNNQNTNELMLNVSRPGLKVRFKKQYENISKCLNLNEKVSKNLFS